MSHRLAYLLEINKRFNKLLNRGEIYWDYQKLYNQVKLLKKVTFIYGYIFL